jgi:hypothetical protein
MATEGRALNERVLERDFGEAHRERRRPKTNTGVSQE